ncbi:hypothetical protein BGZ76_001735 [Entomortierella beljakovae]|nr:hypothetical protein BGZ76_001735 [Entomortierella beljakovae]
MDGAAFQGMPRIALTPAEEALIPRPHSSASQVASAVPSTYSRLASPPPQHRHPHHKNHHSSITQHPYYSNTSASGSIVGGFGSSVSIPIPADPYSRPSSSLNHHPAGTHSSPSNTNINTNNSTGEQEYPQNPQDSYHSYYPQVPPRPSSPGPSRLAFSLTPHPARSPSPQLYSSLYDGYSSRPSYFNRSSYDTHPRPGSPLQQEHQDAYENSIRVASPESYDGSKNDSDDENESVEEQRERPPPPQRSNSKSILTRLKETTSRLSFGDDSRKPRASMESDQGSRNSRDSSASRPGKEVLQDLSDEEKQQQQEPRWSRSGWRPSLSLIRQESSGSNANYYPQNDPNRISGLPSHISDSHEPTNSSNKVQRRKKGGKNKKKTRRAKKRRAEQQAALQKQQQLYEQQLAEQDRIIPGLSQVLEKKTRYPLSYDEFEAFLRSQRAVEYLNFWADVTAHEQLCRTFDVSERRHKREQQLEERAIARDRRRLALAAAMESGRLTPDRDHLTSSHAIIGSGTGIGIGASGEEISGSNLYIASRSSLQLPLNDHLSFPPENRRYGIQDSSAPFTTTPPLNPNNLSPVSPSTATFNRPTPGNDLETNRPSLEEAHISEQDAAVAAVALRAQHNGLYPYNNNQEDVRRGSFDIYRPLPNGNLSTLRFQQNNSSNGYIGGALSSNYSAPNAYNMLMRGRGSMDVMARPNSRSSRIRLAGGEDYFSNPTRNNPHQPSSPQLTAQDGNEQIQSDANNALRGLGINISPDLRHKASQQSIGFLDPDINRRQSNGRFGGGVGPLQAPVSIRRSGESGYTPSIAEGKGLLVQSFRTISLEDLLESALRIYRKYLIQLRTASMAAEEEAAAYVNKDLYGNNNNFQSRKSLDKSIAPGWDGYAEEVITEWNEKWQERRLRRISSRRSILTRARNGIDFEGPGNPGGANHLSIDTRSGRRMGDASEKSDIELEDPDHQNEEGETTSPTSPISAKIKKKTGTGLSSMLNPFLTRLMLTETTVVELPTLTINTTTVEEAAVLDDSADEYEDDDDDYDDEDDDEEDEDDEDDEDRDANEERASNRVAKNEDKKIEGGNSIPSMSEESDSSDKGIQTKSTQQNEDETEVEEVVVLERSMPTPHITIEMGHDHSTRANIPAMSSQSPGSHVEDNGVGVGADSTNITETVSSRKNSTSSSLSSSWDHITRRDLEKKVTIFPSASASVRSSPYQRPGGKARPASNTAQKVGGHLSALLHRSIRGVGSRSSSLDTIQVTPSTSPTIDRPSFRFQIPAIIMNNQEFNEKRSGTEHIIEGLGIRSPTSISTSGTNNSFVHQLQGEPVDSNTGRSSLGIPRPSIPFLTPDHSPISNPTTSSSPSSSLAPSMAAPRPSVSSPAAVAVSAAAAAFYLPLECRQRIHGQVQEEGRTYAPYLYGPAKGFVADVVLLDHYYPLFLEYVDSQNIGLLTRNHPNNVFKKKGMIWIGILSWLIVIGVQLTLIMLGHGGWSSPWVWLVGIFGGYPGSICLATGIKEFSPILGLLGKM